MTDDEFSPGHKPCQPCRFGFCGECDTITEGSDCGCWCNDGED